MCTGLSTRSGHKKVVVITSWSYKRGGRKAGFHGNSYSPKISPLNGRHSRLLVRPRSRSQAKTSFQLKCYYDEKIFWSFSVDSDFIFGKNAPYQLLRLNFKNKSDVFNNDFLFKLSTITRFCSSRVQIERERDVIYLRV